MTSTMWKDWSRPRRTGYTGSFGDSFFTDCWDVVERPAKIIQEDVTTDVPEEKVKPIFRKSHLRSRLNSGDDVYQVMLDVRNFSSSDLSVKLVNDKTIIVEGKHGERKDPEGFVSREFTRKYNLPDTIHPSTIESYLSSDGVLVIRGQAGNNKPPSPLSSNKPTFDLLDTATIPVFTKGYHHSDLKTNNASNLKNHEQQHQERIIPITVEDRMEIDEPGSGRSSQNSTSRDERDRMTTPDPINHTRHHQSSFSKANESNTKSTANQQASTSRAEKERTVSFDESYDETVGSPKASGRNSRMSDDAFDSRRSPFFRDEGRLHQTHFDDVFSSPRSPAFPRDRHFSLSKDRDIFADLSIPRWKDMTLPNNNAPLASKEEHYDKHFEKGYNKNGNWTESFEERFRSEQYSVSSSQNHRDDRSIKNQTNNGNLKERLLKISSPA